MPGASDQLVWGTALSMSGTATLYTYYETAADLCSYAALSTILVAIELSSG